MRMSVLLPSILNRGTMLVMLRRVVFAIMDTAQ